MVYGAICHKIRVGRNFYFYCVLHFVIVCDKFFAFCDDFNCNMYRYIAKIVFFI